MEHERAPLEQVVERWFRHHGDGVPSATLDLFAGCARTLEGPRRLAPSELRLLTFLALNPRRGTIEHLLEELWPHLDYRRARNLAKVLVHRLRRKLGERVCVAVETARYAPGALAIPDLDRVASDVRTSARIAGPLETASRRSLRALRAAMSDGRPAHLASAEWFAVTERRLQALEFDATLVLARDALLCGSCDDALSLTHALIESDPFDEAAREVRFAALARCCDDERLRGEYESYERLIRRELRAEPSARLRELALGTRAASA